MVGENVKVKTIVLVTACGLAVFALTLVSCSRTTDERTAAENREPGVASTPVEPTAGAVRKETARPESNAPTRGTDNGQQHREVVPGPARTEGPASQDEPRAVATERPPDQDDGGGARGNVETDSPKIRTRDPRPTRDESDSATTRPGLDQTDGTAAGAETDSPKTDGPDTVATPDRGSEAMAPAAAPGVPAPEVPSGAPASKTTPGASTAETASAGAKPEPVAAKPGPAPPPTPVTLPKSPRETECEALRADFQRALPGWLAQLEKEGRLDSRSFWTVFSEWLQDQTQYSAETRQQVAAAIHAGLGLTSHR